MVECPECRSKVDQDFGMVTCPHCHAVFMIEYSGQVIYGENDDADQFSTVMPENQSPAFAEFAEPEDDLVPAIDGEEPEFYASPNGQEYEGETDEPFAETGEESDDAEPLWADDSPGPNLEETSVNFRSPDQQPVSITEFAVAGESSLEDGDYLYTLQISRIDSKALKEAVFYTLSDVKLALVPDQMMKKVIHGRLVIPDLNPLKAKRIVEQLQFYDLDITWRQRAVVVEENDTDVET